MFDIYEPDGQTEGWKGKINQIRSKYGIINSYYKNSKEKRFQGTEVGISHANSGSHVKIHDDGTIDLFASSSLGIRLDPVNQAINIIAKKVSINTENYNLQTNPSKFKLNSNPIDIDTIQVRDAEVGQIYSDEFKSLLKELGLDE
ncbi:MAG TPA: hypothetical protein VK190_03145 [Pseudoneobacillus sp.]|nr:hypothetical protein [Pseudoneobacillus sp.]